MGSIPAAPYPYTDMKIKGAELNHAIIKELCSGRQFLDSLQKYREVDAAKIAHSYKGVKPNKQNGWRHLAEIPQREYMQIGQKYGFDAWEDRGFVKDFQRLEPSMASNKI